MAGRVTACVTELCLASENVTEPSTLHGQQTFQSDFQQFQFRRHTHTHSHTYRENDLHMSWPKNKGTQLAHTFSPSQTHSHSHTWQPFPPPHAWRWQRQTKQEPGKTSKRVNFEVQRPVDTLGCVCHLLNTIKISLKYQQGYFIVSFNF